MGEFYYPLKGEMVVINWVFDWIVTNYYNLIIFVGLAILTQAILKEDKDHKRRMQKVLAGFLVLLGCVIRSVVNS